MSLALLSMVLFLLSASSAPTQPAQPSAHVAPTPLQISSSRVLDVPAFGFNLPIRCDSGGNLYFEHGTLSAPHAYVLKLSPDTETPEVFRLPAGASPDGQITDFYLDGSGRVWLLDQGFGKGMRIYAFDSSGKLLGQRSIPVTAPVGPNVLAVNSAGTLLIAGSFDDGGPKPLAGRDYISVYDRGGRIVKQMVGADVYTKKLASVPRDQQPMDAAATVGPDGNFYYANSEKLIVISPEGNIVRQVLLHLPSRMASVNQISIAKKLASVTFYEPISPSSRTVRLGLLVMNVATGQKLGDFVLPGGKGSPACFSADRGYTIVGSENGKIKLTLATIPK